MIFSRRHKNLKVYLALIALAVVMRSFIAPGYMLSISADGGLGITFCDGVVAMYQADHSHDHHDHDGDDGTAESHISTTCSFWSTSGLQVINTAPIVEPVVTTRRQDKIPYRTTNPQQIFVKFRVIRGPPVSFFS